jgi:hypothetical protein
MVYSTEGFDPMLEAAGFGGTLCNEPLPILGDDSGPFRLEITSVVPEYHGNRPEEGEWLSTDIDIVATLSYEGKSGGAVEFSDGAWALIRDDGMIVQTVGGINPTTLTPQNAYSLDESFSASTQGWLPLYDCMKSLDTEWDPINPPEEILLGPGTYSVVAIAQVEWSAQSAILLDADQLGLNASWFGAEWRNVIPCRDAIAEAKSTQNGNAVECMPHLYYQQIRAVGDYAIVDVPSDFFDGPRKTWYVVSDPYPIELPLPPAEPIT